MPTPGISPVAAMVEMGEAAAPYIPFWRRVEPRCRNDNFAPGLEAKSADPFWLLARQWQVGEFQGEDTGSPISVEFATKTQPITNVELGPPGVVNTKIDLDENSPPLEMLVESEYIELDWRTSARIGQQLERLLHAETGIDVNKVICRLRQRYSIKRPGPDDHISMDRTTQRFLSVMAGRTIDGGALIGAVQRTLDNEVVLPP